MVREFIDDDLNEINRILKDECLISDEELKEFQKRSENKTNTTFVYDESGIKGFIELNKTSEEFNKWSINIYVLKNSRKSGIASLLYKKASEYLKNEKANLITISFRKDIEDSTEFFKKLGFKTWFSCYDMKYTGTKQSKSSLEFKNYEDRYFEKYEKLGGECFYELRKANDITPYKSIEISDENRKNTLKRKDNIYITVDSEDEIIASVFMENGIIDFVMVNSKYQGNGYGRETMKFAINKCIERGYDSIVLGVVKWNEKALKLYKSLGFEKIEETQFLRQFMDKE